MNINVARFLINHLGSQGSQGWDAESKCATQLH